MADILIVEDDDDIRDILIFNLNNVQMEARGVNNGAAALAATLQQKPDLIIMDLMMPVMDGKELCRRLKADGRLKDIPVIMLTAKTEEVDKIIGFELGADDYVTKPFSMKELLLRVQALLRRAKSPLTPEANKRAENTLIFGELIINPLNHEAAIDREPLNLTATEFKLLYFLAKHPNRVMSRERLLNEVWGYDEGYDRTVDTHIRRLRVKLKGIEHQLETIRGVGYRFKPAIG